VKVKVTLRRATDPVDLVVTTDATATVGDVAAKLAVSDPHGLAEPNAAYTLYVADPFGARPPSVLDPDATIGDSVLMSGSVVSLTPADSAYEASRVGAPVALLRVLSGPDAGTDFPLRAGAAVIGRDRDVDIRLSDPLVSKRHARVNVGDAIEIIDLNSANGVSVAGATVGRAALTGTDTVTLGDTTLCVIRLQQTATASEAPGVEHVRSPRVVARYPGEEFPAPTPPKPAARHRLPYLALLAPLVMGAVMWAVTRQLLGVLMMGMSPILLIAGYVDQGITARRDLKAQRKAFDAAMVRTRERLGEARDEERRVRLQESVRTADLVDAVRRLGPLVWTERPEHPTFLAINTGIGTLPSRNTVVLPTAQDTLPDCWDRLIELRDEFALVDGVPVEVQLRESGSFGIAGDGALQASVARAAVLQLVARHSPAELVVAAFTSTARRGEWDWLKWLPHTSAAQSPLGTHLADSRGAALGLLAQLEGLIDARVREATALRGPIDPDRPPEQPAPVVPAVVVVVENDAPADRARLTRVVERGPDVGVHVVWCAPAVDRLPAACRSYLTVATTPEGVVGQVRWGTETAPVALESLDVETAGRLARVLAPVVDVGAPESDDSDLPRSVSYPQLAGLELLDSPGDVVDRWRQNQSLTPRDGSPPVPRRTEGTLRALVGHAGSEPFTLDLRTDGPHALVGGTTGAGKSEFLQAWVLGMAAAHSPDRLTFLFVDYKGGSAFAECVDLPHTVGLVTDLSPHLVRRALTSLRAELRHREHLLNEKAAKDLVTLEKRGDPDCPPSLVIVVDEFAALVNEVPEFVDGVVDVAQRGRSLGLHLVLATQRPAGVIKDNLRANTNLRIALRMADVDDSVDILGDARAAHFDPSIPGRGAAKTGPGRIRGFQTGYTGGHTTGEPPKARVDVHELDFGGNAEWFSPEVEVVERGETGPTDIARIVATVRRAATDATVPAPRKPWLSELAPIYTFSKLPNPRTDERLLLGVVDRPDIQAQPAVFYEPDRDGNLAIFGTGGSGKSTALRTIAVAAAATTRNGGPTHVYGLDFGARGLSMLEGLPHVGAIVSGDDEERVVRTLRMLRDTVDERADRYAAVRAGSIAEHRRLANAPEEPRILLLIDGVGVFREQYEFGSASLSAWFTAFAQIAADGRPLGVHVVVTGDRPNSLPTSIASTVQRRIVLRLASEDDYMMLGAPKDVLSPASPAGRGILDGDEVQLAILGESGNIAVQAREMQRLATSLGRAGGARPAPIRRLPEVVSLAELPSTVGGLPVIAVDDATLGPAILEPFGPLIVAGSPGSGRTTALDTIARAVAQSDRDRVRVLLSPRRSASRAEWHRRAESPEDVAELAVELTSALEGAQPHLIVLESLAELADSSADSAVSAMLRAAVRAGHFVVGESETSTWSQTYDLGKVFKAAKRGVMLMPGDGDVDNLLDARVGPIRRQDYPPGRGFLVVGGRVSKIQVAIHDG
jgi:S-DNA-T family DNA segregation ATPase FtsK/SpoIIIE